MPHEEVDPADIDDEYPVEEIPDPLAEFFERARNADRSWMPRGECQGLPTEFWFPDRQVDSASFYEFPRFVCEQCPVRQRCLDYAVETGETEGMWGGMTPEQRHNYKHGRTADCAWCGETFTPGRGRFCRLSCRLRAQEEAKAHKKAQKAALAVA